MKKVLVLPLDNPDRDGNTPLHLAAGNKGLSKLLMRVTNSTSSDIKERLAKMDVNARNKQGLTAMHLACQHGQLEMVEWLLSCEGYKAGLRTEDERKLLPTDLARENEFQDIVDILESQEEEEEEGKEIGKAEETDTKVCIIT